MPCAAKLQRGKQRSTGKAPVARWPGPLTCAAGLTLKGFCARFAPLSTWALETSVEVGIMDDCGTMS